MPATLKFETRAALVSALKGSQWESRFREIRGKDWTIQDVIHQSVGPNTFRSFRGLPERPSRVFRSWAQGAFDEQLLATLRTIRNQTEFDALVRRLSRSLQREWMKTMAMEMKLGPSIKLPNLVLKHVCACRLMPQHASEALTPLLHVPLDSFTLGAIRIVHNDCDPGQQCHLPSGASMGWIDNWTDYRLIQSTISECAIEAGVPPIAFDILAWNGAHT